MRRNLSPALFPSWQATCKAFGAAISAGPGLVILVGGPGSGKTFTLLAFAGGASAKKVSLRGINEPLEPGTEIDLIDNVDARGLAQLAAFEGTRAVAIRPNLVATVKTAFPDARMVTVRPMSSRDVRVMVEVRRPQLGLPVGYFTSKALTRMDELCLGNPRQLDDLLFLSLRLVVAAATARVAPGHVEQAALQLVMEQSDNADGQASLDRETVLEMLQQAEAQRMGFGRGSAPAYANSPSNSTFNPAARRAVQPAPARSSGRAAAKHEAPHRTPPSAAALTHAGAHAPARDRRVAASKRARFEQAGSRRRRTASRSFALAAVAVVALAVAVREVPQRLSWLSGGGQSVADAGPDASSPAAATPSPSPTGTAVPAPTPAVRATTADPEALRPAGPPQPTPPPAPDVHTARPQNTRVAAAPASKAIEPQHAAPTPPTALAAAPAAPPEAVLPPREAPSGSVVLADPDRSTVAGPTNDEARLPASPPAMAPDAPVVAPLPEATVAVRPPEQAAPTPAPEPAVGLAATARPRDDKEAARLLSLGKALIAINQIADAKEVMKSSAEMGNKEAAALLAAYDAPSGPRRSQSRTVSAGERDGARTRLPVGTAARRSRD